MESVSPSRIEKHLRVLTQDIGVRLAGSAEDRQAAQYVADRFRETGARVTVESYPVMERSVRSQDLEVRLGNVWRSYPCSLFSGTPGTGGTTLEAPLVFFDPRSLARRPDLSFLTGQAVVHLGCHIESREAYRRLIEARPLFLLFVDVRHPGTTPLADGMFPAYVRALGAVPTVNVAYLDAWQWKADGAGAARLCVVGGPRESTSCNVIAEWPGSDPDPAAGLLFAGGHHDTQADSVGADDNGTGTAGVLELARVLAPVPRRRTLRLISFGAEEQLSVGSAEYVRRHREEIAHSGRFMFNLDSYGSLLGWTDLICNGPGEMGSFLRAFFEERDCFVNLIADITPYSDHFPFVAAGVPAAFLYRPNCVGGRFFHHRADDDMSRVSTDLVARLLDAVAGVLSELAVRERLPFGRDMAEPDALKVKTLWDDLFGGWGQGNLGAATTLGH